MPLTIFNEMKSLLPLQVLPAVCGEIEVSLIIPARKATHSIRKTIKESDAYLRSLYQSSFEIILVPNPSPDDASDRSIEIAESLAQEFPSVRVYPHQNPPGKGAAIRKGFSHSRGKFIYLTDSDLPYDLEFFDRAHKKLESGFDLVTGNRRLSISYFHIPVRLLRITYSRHRLGQAFNKIVRLLLPIQTTDTQAGIKAMSRRLAFEAFQRQACPGFLFDIEIFLTAIAFQYPQVDLPVTLYLNSEKSTIRILRECLLVANWLTRITWKNSNHSYGPKSSSSDSRSNQ